jgi:SNF2 family DNA or RNA helicase
MHTTNSNICVYHGQNRTAEIIKDSDVIITSYSTLIRDKDVFMFDFERVILDEAHYIRNHRGKCFKYVINVKSKNRWVVTATPLFNDITDMYAYFVFLKIIDGRQSWKKLFGKEKDIIQKLKILNNFSQQYSYRILKEDVLSLKKKQFDITHIELSDIENEFYETLSKYCELRIKRLLRKIKCDDTNVKQLYYSNVLVFILRLKQMCNSPWLVVSQMSRLSSVKNIEEATSKLKYFNDAKNRVDECVICYDDVADMIMNPCGHKYCKNCCQKLLNTEIFQCPTCRDPFDDIISVHQACDQTDTVMPCDILCLKRSAKIIRLMDLIRKILNINEKVVIVSQWVKMLDLVKEVVNTEQDLKDIKSITLEGSVSIADRVENIRTFQDKNSNVNICYISLMCSAEGINLTAANNMILLDSWWNESKLTQVCDRIHRIGQEKDVRIHQFVVSDSIEQKIQKMIKRKANYGKMIMNKWNDKYDATVFDKESLIN